MSVLRWMIEGYPNKPTRRFSPKSLPGLGLWLLAGRIGGADGSAVASWSDLSGNGNTPTQAVGGVQPTLVLNQYHGRAVVRADGVDDLLFTNTYAGIASSSFTIGLVVRRRAAAAAQAIIALGASVGARLLRFEATDTVALYAQNVALISASTGTLTDTAGYHALVVTHDATGGGATSFYLDGVAIGTGTTTGAWDDTAGQLILAQAAGGGSPAPIDYEEVVWYTRVLTAGERGNLQRYLVR